MSMLPETSTRPRNVEQIVHAAQQYEFDAQVPLRYWLRAALAIQKEADIYLREGDDETTYLLLYRYAHLILSNLTTHPQAKDKSLQSQLSQAQATVNRNLEVLQVLKPKINQRYNRHVEISRDREARREKSHQRVASGAPDSGPTDALQSSIRQLHGHEHSELAVELAHREITRRADERNASRKGQKTRADDPDDLSKRLQAIRSRIEPSQSHQHNEDQMRTEHHSSQVGYNYPQIRSGESRRVQSHEIVNNTRDSAHQAQISVKPPALPPKPALTATVTAPARPDKLPPKSSGKSHAQDVDKHAYTFTPSAYLESGAALRTVFLPPTLRTTFLRIAHKNTLANLETCGFLAGTLISNAFFVSKLIIPAQTATSDTCEMTNESQLFDYVDSGLDLMVLGWIHTHPTQTCFMSSRDLHTHAGYQMMLAESVAIVCAPSQGDTTHGGDWGVFRLTDPPGKMSILNCTRPGLFHPHDVDNVYTDALRPGHVVEARGLEFEVVDLRDG